MDTIPELIDAFGGPTAFGRVIGKRSSTASEMKRSRSIPLEYWDAVMAAAPEHGIEGVNEALLHRIHRAMAIRPSPKTEAAE